jgi:hypothetical protein
VKREGEGSRRASPNLLVRLNLEVKIVVRSHRANSYGNYGMERMVSSISATVSLINIVV